MEQILGHDTYSEMDKMVHCSGSSFARLEPITILWSDKSFENEIKIGARHMIELVDEDEIIKQRKQGRYTNEELLNYLKEFYEEKGKVPAAIDFSNNPKYPCSVTYQMRFNSWNNALEKAGLKQNKKDEYSIEELLSLLNKFYEENGRIPNTMDLRNNPKYPNFRTYLKYFSTWKKTLEAAGFDSKYFTNPRNEKRVHKSKYTKFQLLEFLRIFEIENGRNPTRRDFLNNPKLPNYQTYKYQFGSWNNAIKAAGLEIYDPNEPRKYTDEELLEFLNKFKSEEGRTPGERDFVNNSKYPGFVTYQRRFETWNNALKLAGLETNIGGTGKQYEKDELLQFLIDAKIEFGRIPVESDFINNTKYPGFTTYVRYFGSWDNALREVGMDLDTSVRKGILDTSNKRGRMWELCIFKSFEKEGAIDHSGKNPKSPIDGTCPNNQNYDAKVAELIGEGWSYDLRRGNRSKIQWFYLGAFDKGYNKLEYAWRIPEKLFINETTIRICENCKYNINNLSIYSITDKISYTFEKLKENWKNKMCQELK